MLNNKKTVKMKKINITLIAIIGVLIIMLILVFSSIWIGQKAKQDSEDAVRSVSLLYLDELAGRREAVVAYNLKSRISDLRTALELMTEDDFHDMEHLQAYQQKMKRLFNLEKFAFIGKNGLIYTSTGIQHDIDQYKFDYKNLKEPSITIKNLDQLDKTVIIALPVDPIPFENDTLQVCFMEISMEDMLAGVSLSSQEHDSTFSNLYTKDGVALSNTILGGLAVEDNLLEALSQAEYEDGYSYEKVKQDFENLKRGEVSFTYNGIKESLSYVPVEGTDWLLTFLIRESVIGDKIQFLSSGILQRSIIQTVVTLLIMVLIAVFIILQFRRSARLQLEKETANAEIRGKQQELEERIALQKKLEDQSKALSEALNAAEQANKAKTTFLSNMSHEIRTPMNAIIGLDNIALNDPNISPETRDYLTKIGSSAEHLLNLINDVLDMSRIESGRMTLKKEEFSFPKLLEAINTMFSNQCQEKGLEYQCLINGDLDDYYIGDNMKLRQILINILGNAVKFTPEGGKVTLAVERKAQYDQKSTLCFTVADTGIGISKEFLPHIFDTFTQEDSSMTNKYGSSGLGLTITKNIVEMMNGEISVESEKGKGTTFYVTVTLDDSQVSHTENLSVDEISLQDLSVLVIDDDPVACEYAQLALEKAGIAAETALSGMEAIEMVKLRHARREPYNLIIVDWKMPDMDGVETTKQIRSIIGKESAIIILTAYRWDDIIEEAQQAGVDSFISKPLFAATVLEEFKSSKQKKKNSIEDQTQKCDLTGKHILLAEDVPINAEIIMMILQMRGIEIDHVENGQLAVDLFSSKPENYYDAILMDMRMPVMDGLEATRTIRAMDRPDANVIPIIALTANAFDEDVQRSLQAGLNAHLTKPVQPEALFETLESLIKID